MQRIPSADPHPARRPQARPARSGRQDGDRDRRLTRFQMLRTRLLLFAMFLGASNDLRPDGGAGAAGNAMWVPMARFPADRGSGSCSSRSSRCRWQGRSAARRAVHPAFQVVFCLLLFLVLGPLYVNPRTTSVVYEIAIQPSIGPGLSAGPWALVIFSVLFTLAVSTLAQPRQARGPDRKVITPVFSIMLVVVVTRSLLAPMGELPVDPFREGCVLHRFHRGYLTMDALAALVFAGCSSSRSGAGRHLAHGHRRDVLQGRHHHHPRPGTAARLPRLDRCLERRRDPDAPTTGARCWRVVAPPVRIRRRPHDRRSDLPDRDHHPRRLPHRGRRLLREAVPQLSTRSGCGGARGRRPGHRNFGLQTVLDAALPILYLLYPLGMTLIGLTLLDRFFGGRRAVYVGAMAGAGGGRRP
ncbi:hypothetical protein HBB16_00335 [Pseudonocardia sp. MCCB 268]|nr:hypothetical protein [Pseudonocardia cytotoxica]